VLRGGGGGEDEGDLESGLHGELFYAI
jgi:hypothetical protein